MGVKAAAFTAATVFPARCSTRYLRAPAAKSAAMVTLFPIRSMVPANAASRGLIT
jgi:hypothetical protein